MNGSNAIRPPVPLAGVQRHAVPLARDPHERAERRHLATRMSPPEMSPERASCYMRSRRATGGRPTTPCDVAITRRRDSEADPDLSDENQSVQRWVRCRCSRSEPGDHPGPAFHHRSGEPQCPQAMLSPRAPWPPKRLGGKGLERHGRRASLQPPPAGSGPRPHPGVVDPRLAQPLAEASSVARRLSRTRPRNAEAFVGLPG